MVNGIIFVFMTRTNFAPKCWFTWKCHFHDASLTKVEQQLRELAWLCDLNKSCSSCHGQQTLFKGHELNQCLTWSNRAHKFQLNAVCNLENFVES